MNHQDACEIATDISQSWRNGLATSVWEEELQEFYGDVGRARRAVAKMRRTCRYPPVIVDFHDAYTAQPPTDPQSHVAICGDCGNDGWVEAPSYERLGIVYSAVRPCGHCRHGKKAEGSSTWKQRGQQDAQSPDTPLRSPESAA